MLFFLRRSRPQPQPIIHPSDVGRILGVRAFSPGDLVFLNDETPRFVADEQPYRNQGLVTLTYRGKSCHSNTHYHPSDIAFPNSQSLWSTHQHHAFQRAKTLAPQQ